MAQDRVGENPTTTDRIRAARNVVYDESGPLIDTSELADALRAHGVEVGTTADRTTEYRNVPRELPLSACLLAVDLGRDPAAFISDTPPSEPLPDSGEA